MFLNVYPLLLQQIAIITVLEDFVNEKEYFTFIVAYLIISVTGIYLLQQTPNQVANLGGHGNINASMGIMLLTEYSRASQLEEDVGNLCSNYRVLASLCQNYPESMTIKDIKFRG